MGKEIETTEEPEAAYLRGVVRRIEGIVERTRETGSWKLAEAEAGAEILKVCATALARPRTNGTVIDQLYERISTLASKAVDQAVDANLVAQVKAENAQLKGAISQLQADAAALRDVAAKSGAGQVAQLDVPGAILETLRALAGQIEFLGENELPLRRQIAIKWAATLRKAVGDKE